MITKKAGALVMRPPEVCFGTARLNYKDRCDWNRQIRKAVEINILEFDTAETYSSGESEAILGDALVQLRDKVFLASKVWPTNCSKKNIILSCERSLVKLKTDRLDLYYIHWPHPFPLEESLEAFIQLKQQGKILNVGLSNFNLQGAQQVITLLGKESIYAMQSYYSLHERSAENTILAFCKREQIKFYAYSPSLRQLQLTNSQRDTLTQIAASTGTANQIALAYILSNGASPIISSKNVLRLTENKNAEGIFLSNHQIERIKAGFPIRDAGNRLAIGFDSYFSGDFKEMQLIFNKLHVPHP